MAFCSACGTEVGADAAFCPKCGKPIRRAVIDRHPTDRDAAIHSLRCADCGYQKTTVLSLRPAAPLGLTALEPRRSGLR